MENMLKIKFSIIFFLCLCSILDLCANNNYRGENGWLNYTNIKDKNLMKYYIQRLRVVDLSSNYYEKEIKSELIEAYVSIFGIKPCFTRSDNANLTIRINPDKIELGKEGYCIYERNGRIKIEAFSDAGLLYATFYLIRLIQCHDSLEHLNVVEIPHVSLRMLNHWDDINGNIERGYAGQSLWKWSKLFSTQYERLRKYARLNASIGINCVVLNNVNADPLFLREDYLYKIATLAKIFRRYNIKVFLSVNFSSPIRTIGIGSLETANPKDSLVQKWWNNKVKEIYRIIPDFGGFLVKANSEGMPGPQDYNCSHADGANLLARALRPYNGWVLWRTFVYNTYIDKDRMKRSYLEFKALDGKFDENVILQTKSGPLDFQAIEPPQPLFGAMRQTKVSAELQISQEYTGHSTYLVYLLPYWKWFVDFNTFSCGNFSRIKDLISGIRNSQSISAIAGVANTGDTINWTGHHFAQANWFAFGRLAWNLSLSEDEITNEWIKCTWSTKHVVVAKIKKMMLSSWIHFVNSVSPYGLGITVDKESHYQADFENRLNKEWIANKQGIGNNRTRTGSDFVSQYFSPNSLIFDNVNLCPEEVLLSFHFVEWQHRMKSGHTLEHDFFYHLKDGVRAAKQKIRLWESMNSEIDSIRFHEVFRSLRKEERDAKLFYSKANTFFREIIK